MTGIREIPGTAVQQTGEVTGKMSERIFGGVDEIIGHTPLVELKNIEEEYNLKARLLAKVESVNPAGSIKDRAALQIINDGEKEGLIKKDTVIIEPTSGNTGIGLAAICAKRGYRLIIVMPDSMSEERKKLMKAYGAELVLTPGSEGMSGSIKKANEIKESIPGSVIAGQFDNPSNPKAHFLSTGPEIWEDTDGKVDFLVAGVGTGGTITGIGEYLKLKNKAVKVVAVEPAGSPLLSKGYFGSHGLQGIGANFIPSVLNTEIYDEIITVSDEDAYEMGRKMGCKEGILVGITAGASIKAAIEIAKRPENENKMIVAVLPDTGDRYLSTKMFD